MQPSPCKPETLLLGTSSDIQYCFDCKMIHLMIGAVTVRLSRAHFQEFVKDMNKGFAQLKIRESAVLDFEQNPIVRLHS